MPGVRRAVWLATFWVAVVALFLCWQHGRGRNDIPAVPARVLRGDSFHRVPPTAPVAPTVAALVSELSDVSPVVRERAAEDLGHAGIEALEAVPDLKRLAASDPDEEVRRASRQALFNVRGGQPSPWGVLSSTPEL